MYFDNGIVQLHHGDARASPLEDESVHCAVTSPPYWGLRDYGLGDDALGLEPTPELYVEHIVEIFREVRRVLRKDGTVWLNMGDSYAGSWGNYHPFGKGGQRSKETERWDRPGYADTHHRPPQASTLDGLKPKDLVGMPWRVAFALQADGWWLRSDIIWSKPNPMPESVQDRPTRAHEYLFLLSKSAKYFYDAEAIREEGKGYGRGTGPGAFRSAKYQDGASFNNSAEIASNGHHGHSYEGGRNKRSVWEIATQPYPEAHFATFPEKLVEPCILAGTSERGVCADCGAPWVREVERVAAEAPMSAKGSVFTDGKTGVNGQGRVGTQPRTESLETTGWRAGCECGAKTVPATVLDPFVGSGTTAVVAQKLGRRAVGMDLSEGYLALAALRAWKAWEN